MPLPDCLAYPLGSFPVDQAGLPNADGLITQIPLTGRQIIVEVKHGLRTTTNGVLDVISNLNPAAQCLAQSATDAIKTGLGSRGEGFPVAGPCRRCGHNVSCVARRSP